MKYTIFYAGEAVVTKLAENFVGERSCYMTNPSRSSLRMIFSPKSKIVKIRTIDEWEDSSGITLGAYKYLMKGNVFTYMMAKKDYGSYAVSPGW